MSEKAEHTPLVADGPDEFGDFHIRSRDERLAKCVVVQNGFRSPEETRALANDIVRSVNALPDLVKALEELLRVSVDEVCTNKDFRNAESAARAAISKHRGDSNA